MKRLAAVLMMLAIATFMGMATAAEENSRVITGTYAMTASGSCLHSEMPYYKDVTTGRWTVQLGSQVYVGVTVATGTWTFYIDGKGSYWQRIYATILPGGHVPPPLIPVEVRVLPPLSATPTSVDFTYEITTSGDITVTQANGIKLSGGISIDGNTVTLLSANNVQPNLPAPFWNTICNTERTLIKVSE